MFIGAAFQTSIELGQGNNRNIKFLGHGLEGTGNITDFLGAVFNAGFSLHKLQVIDNHHTQIVVGFESSCLGAHFQNRNTCGIVYIYRGIREHPGGSGQFGPVRLVEMAGSDTLGVNAANGAEHTERQLFHGHLKAEHRNRYLVDQTGMLHHVHDQCCFSHGGATGKDNQVRGLQTCGHSVQLFIACGNPGNMFLAVCQPGDAVKSTGDNAGHGLKALFLSGLGNFKDGSFRIVNQGLNIILGVVTTGGNFRSGLDQPAKDCLFSYDIGMMNQGSRKGNHIDKRCQVGGATYLIQLVLLTEHIADSNDVMGFPFVKQGYHGLKNDLMCVPVKIFSSKDFNNFEQGFILEQDSAKDRLFRFNILRRQHFVACRHRWSRSWS